MLALYSDMHFRLHETSVQVTDFIEQISSTTSLIVQQKIRKDDIFMMSYVSPTILFWAFNAMQCSHSGHYNGEHFKVIWFNMVKRS